MKTNRKNEEIQKGGEIARAIYQTFMQSPAWMTHIRKDALVKFLNEIINEQKEMIATIQASADKMIGEDFDFKAATTEEVKKRVAMICDRSDYLVAVWHKQDNIRELEVLRDLFAPKDATQRWFYGDNKRVHADFSMYCRDN